MLNILLLKKRALSLFVLSLLFCHNSFAQTGPAIAPLAECVLNALRSTNDSLVYQCLPDKKGFEWLQQMAINESGSLVIGTDSLIKNIQQGAKENIHRVREKLNAEEIDLTSIQIDSIVGKPVTLFDLGSVTATNITIHFTANKKAHQLKISRCILILNEWRLMDKISLRSN